VYHGVGDFGPCRTVFDPTLVFIEPQHAHRYASLVGLCTRWPEPYRSSWNLAPSPRAAGETDEHVEQNAIMETSGFPSFVELIQTVALH